MYEMEYSHSLDNTYLILKGITLKRHEEKMISHNRIPYLMNTMFMTQDNESYIYYDITSSISINDYVKKYSPKENWIKDLFISLLELNDISNEYFLSNSLFLIEPEYIFYNNKEGSFRFIYLPADYNKSKELIEGIKNLIDFLFTKLNQYDEAAIKLMYKLKLVTEEESVTMNDIKDVLEQEQTYIDDEERVMPIKIVPEATNRINKKPKSFINKEQLFIYIAIELCIVIGSYIGVSILIGNDNNSILFRRVIGAVIALAFIVSQFILYKTLVKEKHPILLNSLKEEDELEKFCSASMIKNSSRKPYLVTRDQVKIPLLKTPFIIGKLKGEVDCCINNSSVSDFHSIIESDEENYYIMDMNSTNGTYLDNRRILSNNQYKINDDSVITFADESYTFKLL